MVSKILLFLVMVMFLTTSLNENQFFSSSQTPHLLEFNVTFNSESPYLAQASLKLPEVFKQSNSVSIRGVDWGLESQIENLCCDDRELVQFEEGKWFLPQDCKKLEWTIRFKEGKSNSVNVSKQESIYFAEQGWWLLSEPTSLLLIESLESFESVLVVNGSDDSFRQIGPTKISENRWRIPPVGGAPEFYAFGNIFSEKHKHGSISSVYVIDDPVRFSKLPLVQLHATALEYYSDIFRLSEELSEKDSQLMVVWLGIDEALGEAGGAAGSRSFLANYVDGDEENIELNAARTTLILAHEQTHQLVDALRPNGPAFPLWMSEGFAHYYGLKALMRTSLPDEIKTMIFDFFIDYGKNEVTGLLELDRKHKAGDASVYPLFYAKGAAFFYELDQLLLKINPESNGLDDWLPILMSSKEQGPGLPEDFVEQIKKQNPDKIMTLINQYLGD